MALTEENGLLARFKLKPGNAAEVRVLPELLDGEVAERATELLGDKAYDSDKVREFLASLEIVGNIPGLSNRRVQPHYDQETYKGRHLIENGFADLKQFRGIATRFAKLTEMFGGMLSLVAWYVGTKTSRRGPSTYTKERHGSAA